MIRENNHIKELEDEVIYVLYQNDLRNTYEVQLFDQSKMSDGYAVLKSDTVEVPWYIRMASKIHITYLAMEGYGPVSVAKVAMEAIIRQIGWELGEFGITANAIQAGITPTRALTKITDRWETWVENTKKRNPMRRTTTPNDVANTVKLLLEVEADFINCSIIYCDGGEHRSGSF